MSEDIDKLNASVRELNDVMRSLSGQMIDLTDATSQVNRVSSTSTQRQQQTADALQRLRTNADGLSEVEKSRIEAQKKLLAYEQQLADAGRKAVDSLKGFASGVLDTNVKLTNLNQGLSSAGDAAFALGKAFGPLGMLIGGAVKGFTMLIEANLKISQAYLESKDSLMKIGGAGAHTTQSLQKMAREADLNAETVGRMIKPMQGMGQSIMALGGNAGDAQKSFAKLIKATDEERAAMMRLGINQEQMMQGTADYLALQSASGRGVKNELQDREKLRKASLDYQTQLVDLAALTGKDVDALKAEQKEMLMNRQVQLKNMMDNAKEDRLRREAEKETDVVRKKQLLEQADAIGKESKARNEAFAALAGGPKVLQKGIQELTTGTINGENAQKLARLGMQKDIDEFNKTIREGGNRQEAAAKLQDAYIKKFGDRVETTGRQMAISGDVAKMYGADSEQELELISNRRQKSYEEERKTVEANRKAAQKPGKDPEADARAALQNANIKAAGAVEDVVSTLNPLKLGLLGLSAAAGAAALALGVMAKKGLLTPGVASGGGGITGMLGGMLGGGKAAPTPTVPSAGGAGAGAAGGVVQGLGQGGGNLLEGAAKGLRAFANPQVALGAAGFGVAIAAVGAGLAGATWIMGKALPTLSEGLGAFTKLDGPKLKATGEGIFELGKGMAVFGVGGAAAGIGSILGNMSEGITKFFGGSTPIDKLQEFSQLNIDPKKTKENAEAFTAFSEAMSKYKGGADTSVASALSSNVVSFMGGDNNAAFTKFAKFSKIDVGDPNKVKKNAEAFVSFSNAMADYKGGGELKNMTDNMIGGLTKMFGGDSVTDKFVKFTKLDVDPERAGKLAEAFSKYANAMTTTAGGAGAAKPVVARASGSGVGSTASQQQAMTGTVTGSAAISATRGSGAPAPAGGVSKPTAGGGGSAPPVMASASSGGSKPTAGGGGSAPPVMASASSGGGGAETDPDAPAGVEDVSTKKPTTSKPKNVVVGPAADITGVDQALLTKFYTAAEEFGKTITVNSAFRGDQKQAELWVRGRILGDPGVMTPAKPKNDTKINYKGIEYNVPGSGKGSKHREGDALDISTDRDAFDPILAKYGLHRPYKQKDPPHVELQAREGGIASGPKTGYPVTMHGNEIIVPLDANSILAELGKKSATQIQTELKEKTLKAESSTGESSKELVAINQAMMEMMASKLDAVINRLETSNDTQGKLLKYSQA